MQVVPDALLLQFAAAELHEAGGDAAAAKEVYERLAAPLDGDREAGAPATPDAKDGAAAGAAQVPVFLQSHAAKPTCSAGQCGRHVTQGCSMAQMSRLGGVV
jgi:hypothetical protein